MDKETFAAIQRSVVRCARCPELRAYCAAIARERKREFASDVYWGKPVPPFGDPGARLLIVGLAPAAHGGNRTGRMFTGDGSANWLARALHAAGFATQPYSGKRGDGYALVDAYMTAALRCAPPGNRPTPRQIANCSVHLERELAALSRVRVVVALGRIAFDVIVRQLQQRGFSAGDRGGSPRSGTAGSATSPTATVAGWCCSALTIRAVRTRTRESSARKCSTPCSSEHGVCWTTRVGI